jgi:hypothetical protein
MRPPGVEEAPVDPEDDERAEEERASEQTEQVPAGRAGADSGSADAVRIDPDDTSEIPDDSEMNDIPGVGPGDAKR